MVRKAADQGNAEAQFRLGEFYYVGKGIPHNYVEASKWFRKAADQGNANAQFLLGLIYDPEDKILTANWYQDNAEAVRWYREAAEQRDAASQFYLGLKYANGTGIPEDYIEAYKWFILAAAQGGRAGAMAKKEKDSLAVRMTPAMIAAAQERARAWGPKSADSAKRHAAPKSAVSEQHEPAASGSGFFVNGKGDPITNHHVVDGCSSMRVWFGGRSHSATVIEFDEKNDLALLRTKNGGTTEKATLRSSAKIALGEQVLVAGYPLRGLLADSLNVASGNVSSLAGPQDDSRLLQICAPAKPGNSGGPVFDQYGLVVGVVVAKLDAVKVANLTGDIPQNVNFAIKGSVLRSFLEVNDTEFTTAEPKQTMKNEEIAAKAKLSTVAVECMK